MPKPSTPPLPPNRLRDEARHLRLKRRFSQNFLTNEAVLSAITERMNLSETDTLLEIGAGAGFLTEKLLEKSSKLIAVELDRRMCAYLRQKFPPESYPQLMLVEQDILRFDFSQIPAQRFKVVGNLPYQITSKIMFLLAGELNQADYPLRHRLQQLTFMVQKEVAERITAQPGQRAYNHLTIALQFWFEATLDFVVPARDFVPAPKVDSAVITLTPREAPLIAVQDMALFAKLVRIAFAQKRKTLRNALLNGGFASADVLDRIFEQTGINPGLRAEAVSIVAFGELANAFGSDTGQN